MPGDYMICMEMSLNGVRIGMEAILVKLSQIPKGPVPGQGASFGAAVGVRQPLSVGHRAVAEADLRLAPILLVSDWYAR